MASTINRLASVPQCLAFLLMLVPIAAFGQATVDFKIGQRESWVGQPLSLRVEITNAESHEAPVIPEVEGASVKLLEQASEDFTVQNQTGCERKQLPQAKSFCRVWSETNIATEICAKLAANSSLGFRVDL